MAPSGPTDHDDDEAATVAAVAVAVAVVSNIAAPQSASSHVPKLEAAVSTSSTSDSTTPTVAIEPAQKPPSQSQDESKEQQQPQQQQPQEDKKLHRSPQLNGDSRALGPKPKPEPESESDMSNHRPGPTAHHQHHHHHHSLSTGYPTSSSSGSSPVYPAPATTLPTTQYASYPAVTSAAPAADPYRVSPVGGTQMPLPSMRTIDAISQQGPSPVASPLPHHTMSMSMSMPLAAVSAAPQYYSSHAMPLPSNYTITQDALARYPLPHDPRLANHRGPKKCDETHPTCNNCRKSKRECLGYDPIFRQQAGTQSGNNIQPAPGSLPSATPPAVAASVYQNPAVGQATTGPRLGNSYGTQPSMLPGVYAPTTAPSPTLNSIAPSTSASYNPPLPTTAAPALAPKAESNYDYSVSNADPAIRQLPATSVSAEARHLDHKPGQVLDSDYPRATTKMKISEIIDLLGAPAPAQQISHTEETFHEITKVYHEMYAGGLSAFFETSWYYFTENGKMTFPKDANLIEHMATFLKILEGVKANDHTQIAVSGVLETRIVWELACTAYQISERTNAMRLTLPPENDATEARNRLQVVEVLLCGDYLTTNPLSPPVDDNDHHRMRQFDFWHSLAEFVRKQDNPSAPMNVKKRDEALNRMRHLLDGRENRDVLYSIAVVRELAPHFEPGYGNSIPQHLDETDPKNRLAVASKFIMDESQVTGGTTNVVRRFSDIASRAFVNPGVNVVRRI
ncbi:hypothetical protein PT974_08787 [Cladobotryum mycophilum]|uniref:Zn(2)-C6 fungal-type domain-containing protein n=1 Tax=Cladobotryum mycophilum TaxID=491253 RepID=A0ABR0SEA6_9HYPO